MNAEPLAVALRIVDVLEELAIHYHLGGSFASSLHGVPRQSHDLDLVADLKPADIPALVARLDADFYIEPEMIRSARICPAR